MDIRNWPIDRIMQLPDCCFGTRYPVTLTYVGGITVGSFDISEMGLPDKCVLWEINLIGFSQPVTNYWTCSLKLGDHLPAAVPDFAALANLHPSLGMNVAGNRLMFMPDSQSFNIRGIKIPIEAQGRRVVASFITSVEDNDLMCILIFSHMPTEVPEWLISGQAKGLW